MSTPGPVVNLRMAKRDEISSEFVVDLIYLRSRLSLGLLLYAFLFALNFCIYEIATVLFVLNLCIL